MPLLIQRFISVSENKTALLVLTSLLRHLLPSRTNFTLLHYQPPAVLNRNKNPNFSANIAYLTAIECV